MQNNEQAKEKEYPFRSKEELEAFIKLLLLDDKEFFEFLSSDKVSETEAQ